MLQGFGGPVHESFGFRLGHQMHDDLAVVGGLEYRSLAAQFFANGLGVNKVAVMSQGQGPGCIVDHAGLGVDQFAFSCGGIAVMADGQRTRQF